MPVGETRSSYTYRVNNIFALKDLAVRVETDGEKLKTSISGVLSPRLRLFIKGYFSSHNFLGTLGKMDGGNIYTLYFPPVPSPAHERLFQSLISTLVFKQPLPLAATIGVTDRCQYTCMHCSAAGRNTNRPVMTTVEIERVIDECLLLGVSNITFTGGEPLLRDDLCRFIARVPRELAVCQVFTNAAKLDAKCVAELKSAGLYGLQISLDSPNPEVHDAMRGSTGAFSAVKQGVLAARQAGLLVGLSTYATRDRVNNGFLLRLAELASTWKVNEITVFDAIETGKMFDHKELMLDQTSRRCLLKEMKYINRLYRGRLRVIPQTWTNSRRGISFFIGCLAAKFQIHITAQGDLTPCDFTPLSFGNIRESSVREMWQSLITHPAYDRPVQRCRMQDPAFRSKYIDTIPNKANLPYRIKGHHSLGD